MKKRNMMVMRLLSVTMISAVLGTSVGVPATPVLTVHAEGTEGEEETGGGQDGSEGDGEEEPGETAEYSIKLSKDTLTYGDKDVTCSVKKGDSELAEGTKVTYGLADGASEDVLTVGEDGSVTILGAGTTKVKATFTVDSTEKTAELEVTVQQKLVTATLELAEGATGAEKVYDGDATIDENEEGKLSVKFEGCEKDENVDNSTIKYSFVDAEGNADVDAAENKTVKAEVTLTAEAQKKYKIDEENSKLKLENAGVIKPVEVTAAEFASGASVTKEYDGKSDYTVDDHPAPEITLTGVLEADKGSVTPVATYAFGDAKAADSGKSVTATITGFEGAKGGNYSIPQAGLTATGAIGSITKKELTVTLTGSITKEYDGGTDGPEDSEGIKANYSLSGQANGDTVALKEGSSITYTYDDKEVGTDKTITAAGVELADEDPNGNYKLPEKITANIGEIRQKTLTAELSGTVEKFLDGKDTITAEQAKNLTWKLTDSKGTEVSDVTVTGADYRFAKAEAGENIDVIASNIQLSDSKNYKLSAEEVTASQAGTIKESQNQEQTLSAENITGKTYGDAQITLEATSDKNDAKGEVSYVVTDGEDVVTIDGDQATIIGAGTATIQATKAADETYGSATATFTITVAKKQLTPSIDGTVTKDYDGNTTISKEQAQAGGLGIKFGDGEVVNSDDVTATADFAFKSADVGTGVQVDATNIKLDEESDKNYELTATTASADVGTIQEVAVTGITLDRTELSMTKGEDVTLKPTIAPENATNQTVIWKSSDENIAAVDENGAVTAVAEGTATITATIKKTTADDAETMDVTCEVTVLGEGELARVELNQTKLSLTTGGSEQLEATVFPTDVTDATLTWSSDSEDIASVSNDGTVTAVAAGTATIKVTAAKGDKEVTAECEVTVTDAVPVTGITLDQGTLDLKVGGEQTLQATVTPEDATSKDITWSSSAENIATVDQNGKVSAIAAGKAVITASIKKTPGADETLTATCEVTVSGDDGEGVTIQVLLDEPMISLKEGEQKKITATVKPEADHTVLTWKSNDEAVATVSEDGTVTAVAAGETGIMVTAAQGEYTGTAMCTVIVTKEGAVSVTGITLNKTEMNLEVNGTDTLTADVAPADATNKAVNWSSSNPSVAAVDADGKVTAAAVGEAVITATAADGSGTTAECKVTVTEAAGGNSGTGGNNSGSGSGSGSGGSSGSGSSSGSGGGSYGGGYYGGSSSGTGTTTPTTPTTPETPSTPGTGTTVPGTQVPGSQTPADTVPDNVVIANVTEQADGTFTDARGEKITNAVVQTDDGTKYIAGQNGEKVTNSVVTTADGTMYCTKADGAVAVNQTVTMDGNKYFAKEDGVVAKDEFCTTKYGNTVYAKADGTLAVNTTFTVDGSKYFAKTSAAIAKNEFCTTPSGSTVYAKADGTLAVNAVVQVSGKKYFAKKSGAIAKNAFSTTPKGSKVYSKANGVIITNKIFKVKGKRYYAKKSGALAVKTWVTVGNKRYYCNASGRITKTRTVKNR